MTKEEWRPIEGYEGLYEVSNFGQVRSLIKGKLLKPTESFNGYYVVNLYLEKKPTTHNVHRLVAVTFLGQPPEGHVVCHGSKGQQCNEVTNLSWGTREKNNGFDKLRDGTDNRGEKNGQTKLTEKQVRVIRRLIESKSMTLKEIGEVFGAARTSISNIKFGRTWGHLESNEEFLIPL